MVTSRASELTALTAMSVADFYREVVQMLRSNGIGVKIWRMPVEVPDPIPFDEDRVHASYDPEAAQRFWRILLNVQCVFEEFRSRFVGKCSPIHFFWGSFDLAVTRFSGRRAPRHPGGVPHLPDAVAVEAYSHEVSSAGFWPGGGAIDYPAFYSYAYPEPAGYGDTKLKTAAGCYDTDLGQFILPYDAVRQASDPDALLLGFLQETYEAAAELAKWDRKALERQPIGAVR